eukprot:jgi/Ulvmu1/1981/UM012_0143.1
MAVASNKILLNTYVRSWSTPYVAELLAHEMCHVRQYRAWGKPGFLCRYSQSGPRNQIEQDCDNFEGTVPLITWPLPKCFRVINYTSATLWSAFLFFSEASKKWESKGWYGTAGERRSVLWCIQRDTELYIHVWDRDFVADSKYSWSHGEDAGACIRNSGPFRIIQNYAGWTWWDTEGPMASDTCYTEAADGYWWATFEFLTGPGYEYTYTTLGRYRLLLSMGAAADAGATGGWVWRCGWAGCVWWRPRRCGSGRDE